MKVETLMDDDDLVNAACQEITDYTANRKSVLIFTSGVHHGRHVQRVMQESFGVECGFVCGETPSNERDELLDQFRTGGLKYLANVNVLTTGFRCHGYRLRGPATPDRLGGTLLPDVWARFSPSPRKTRLPRSRFWR